MNHLKLLYLANKGIEVGTFTGFLVDNVLFYGSVVVSEDQLSEKLKEKFIKDEPKLIEGTEDLEKKKIEFMKKGIKAIKQLNEMLTTDERIDATLLQIADGIGLIRKK